MKVLSTLKKQKTHPKKTRQQVTKAETSPKQSTFFCFLYRWWRATTYRGSIQGNHAGGDPGEVSPAFGSEGRQPLRSCWHCRFFFLAGVLVWFFFSYEVSGVSTSLVTRKNRINFCCLFWAAVEAISSLRWAQVLCTRELRVFRVEPHPAMKARKECLCFFCWMNALKRFLGPRQVADISLFKMILNGFCLFHWWDTDPFTLLNDAGVQPEMKAHRWKFQ